MANTDVDTTADAGATSTPDKVVNDASTGGTTVGKDAGAAAGKGGAAADATGGKAADARSVAAGGKAAAAEPGVWPQDWAERAAAAIAPKDTPEFKKALGRIKRYADPTGLAAKALSLEEKLSSGLVRVPGPKATEDDKTEWRDAIGVPKEAAAYLEKLTLGEGKVLGEADKPMALSFATALHKADAPPAVVSAAINWYQDFQEQQTQQTYQQDRTNYNETQAALAKEWGPAKDSNVGVISSLFSNAPGGADPEKEDSLMGRLLSARMPDGRLVGDDMETVKWMTGLALAINPAATIVPDGKDARKSVEDEIGSLRALASKDDSEYWQGPKAAANQRRMVELLGIRDKLANRAA